MIDHARQYTERGIYIVPIPHGQKRPTLKGWQHLRLDVEDLPRYFNGAPQNLGVLLSASGLQDVDLDTEEAVRLAPAFLPPTLTMGRESAPRSHWIYRTPERRQTTKYQLGRETLVELRDESSKGTPHQTVFPPSVHPSGEAYRFFDEREIAEVDADELAQRVALLAAAVVFVRHWPRSGGTRHDAALALASVLLRAGVSAKLAETFLRAVAQTAGDAEVEDRVATVSSTADALALGQRVTGVPTLLDLLAQTSEARSALQKALGWLGFTGSDAPPEPAPVEEAEALDWQAFPVDMLPPPCADYARAKAAAIGCDVAFVAAPMLPVQTAAVGNSYSVAVKQSWRESSAVWLGVVANSGGGKSPGIEGAMDPIDRLEEKEVERYTLATEAYDFKMERYEALSKKERQLEECPQKPKINRRKTGNITSESYLLRNSENTRGLLNYNDELAVFLDNMNRYARGDADIAVWLEVWGSRPVTVDRKSSEQPFLYIKRPNCSLLGGIQPGVLRERAGPKLTESGFLARLLLVMPPERPLYWTDADVHPEVKGRYRRLIERLYALPESEESIPLSSEARQLFAAFVNENADLYADMRGPLRSAYVKLPSYAARFALALHLADFVETAGPGERPAAVSAYAMRRAVTLARWFRYEAARIYQHFDLAGENPETVLESEERRRFFEALPQAFTTAEAVEIGLGIGMSNRKAVTRALKTMKDRHGLIKRLSRGHYEKTVAETPPPPPVPSGDGVPEDFGPPAPAPF